MNRNHEVRFITFDVGGTLIHPSPSVGAVYAEVLTRRGFPAQTSSTEVAFEEAWEEMARRVPRERERYAWSPQGERGYWASILALTVRRLGGERPPAGAAEELFEVFGHRDTWRVFPEVPATLERLREIGIQMGIVSNWDSRLPGLLRELGIRHHFGPIVVSALEGYEKPDPRLFRLAAERANVEPRRTLHVGDRLREDVEGATNAGCHALRVERDGHGSPGLEKVFEHLPKPSTSIPRRELS